MENRSTKGKMCTGGKYKYVKIKYGYARMENASRPMEISSTSEQGQYYSTYSVLYTLSRKKGATGFFAVTFTNIDGFS